MKASEKEFSAAFKYASIGIALVGLNGEWLRVNKSFCNILGYSSAELMLCNFQDITHVDDFETDLGFLKQLVDDEIPSYQMAKRYYTKTGEIIWTNLSVSKILHADGSIKHFVSQIENINDRKLAEIALYNERERMKNVLDGTNAGTWELNIETGETVYNERWAAIAGYTLQELQPIDLNTWRNLVHPEDLISSDKKLQACFEKNETYYDCECRLKHKDGYWVWVLDRGKVISRTADGQPLLISGTQIDISAIKNAEQAVKEKQALLETILNSIDVGIVACNSMCELTLFNKATEKMHGLPVKGLPAKEWAAYYDLFEVDGITTLAKENVPLYQALKNGYVTTEQIAISPKNGNNRIVKCSGSQIKDELGNVYGAVVVMQDITEQNKFEKLLSFNEKRFRGIFNATHQLIGFLDLEGNLMEANDTALKFAGLKPEDVVGKKFWDCYWWSHSKEEQEKLKVAFNEAVKGKFIQYEATHVNADGKFVTIIFNLKPLFDDEGKVMAVIPEGRPIQDIA
ncbi:MAG: PAS domain S-box protein, partial [Ferruginibacter sp.]|nr:PAS domain S-box protein [Ferruginibacter sp.]